MLFSRFDESATPPQVNINEDLPIGETVVNVKAVMGKFGGRQHKMTNLVIWRWPTRYFQDDQPNLKGPKTSFQRYLT